jgi:hypothetical protein
MRSEMWCEFEWTSLITEKSFRIQYQLAHQAATLAVHFQDSSDLFSDMKGALAYALAVTDCNKYFLTYYYNTTGCIPPPLKLSLAWTLTPAVLWTWKQTLGWHGKHIKEDGVPNTYKLQCWHMEGYKNKSQKEYKMKGNFTNQLGYIGCYTKSFTTLKAYINLFRGHVQCFELS